MNDCYGTIPGGTLEALFRYTLNHCPTGSFLEAVLSNNLKGAVGQADIHNRAALFEIVDWVVSEAPFGSQGSPQKYAAWVADFDPSKNKEVIA